MATNNSSNNKSERSNHRNQSQNWLTIIGDNSINPKVRSFYGEVKMLLLNTRRNNDWKTIIFFSAFLTFKGANILIDLLNKYLTLKSNRPDSIVLVIGKKYRFTEPRAIRRLIDFIQGNANVGISFELVCPDDENFHVKTYLFLGKKYASAIIGSANMTGTGFESKGELCMRTGNSSFVCQVFNHLKYYIDQSQDWINYIDQYAEEYSYRKSFNAESELDKEVEVDWDEESVCDEKSPQENKDYSLNKIDSYSVELEKISKYFRDRKAKSIIEIGKLDSETRSIIQDLVSDLSFRSNISEKWYFINDYNTGQKEYGNYRIFHINLSQKELDWNVGSQRRIAKVHSTRRFREGLLILLHKDILEYTVDKEVIEVAQRHGVYKESAPSENDLISFEMEIRKLRKRFL